jgi:hypothetical protein
MSAHLPHKGPRLRPEAMLAYRDLYEKTLTEAKHAVESFIAELS